jgi:hypothetical protein
MIAMSIPPSSFSGLALPFFHGILFFHWNALLPFDYTTFAPCFLLLCQKEVVKKNQQEQADSLFPPDSHCGIMLTRKDIVSASGSMHWNTRRERI